jgi:hypothetical protein
MIPMMNIIAWSAKAPWAETRQVEQDLIMNQGHSRLPSESGP